MLMHDLAEANRNTAAHRDGHSLNTVRTTGETAPVGGAAPGQRRTRSSHVRHRAEAKC
jgi:hypothetical protein